MNKNNRIILKLDDETKDFIKAEADKTGVPMSTYIRMVLMKEMTAAKQRRS